MKSKKKEVPKNSEKWLRNKVKKFFKEVLKEPEIYNNLKIQVISLNPSTVRVLFPFYSEGNLIRVNEMDFIKEEFEKKEGIKLEIFYQDEEWEMGS